jgi:hypothetical protein
MLREILELIGKIEDPDEECDVSELQGRINELVEEAMAQSKNPLVTRDALMRAIQFRYRKYAAEIEKQSDRKRRGDLL